VLSGRNVTGALLAVLALIATTASAADARARLRDNPPASGHVAVGLDLRLGAGVTYRVVSTANQCADDLELPADTTTKAAQVQWMGFNPSNAVLDGCFTRASWSFYQLDVTAPWTGRIQFSFGQGVNGGSYYPRCMRWDSEYGLWCHVTGPSSVVIGKLN
jgi:hypothetical protein